MLVAWNDINRTFAHLDQMRRRMERAFTDYDDADAAYAAWAPAGPRVSVEENEARYFVRALVPGMGPSDVQVKVTRDELVIEGERQLEPPEGYRILRRERQTMNFTRTIGLPAEVDADSASATVHNGVLTVTLPKIPEVQPRVIQIAGD